MQSYAVDPDRVLLEIDAHRVQLPISSAIPCGLAVNELVTNALKHAYEEGGGGVVRVTSRALNGGLELEVSDDGQGMKARSSSTGTGLGRRLIETFAKHLNAKVEVSTSPAGTTHKILVPALA